MNLSRNRSRNDTLWETARPALAGLLLSCAVTAVLIAAFSVAFVLLETIFDSAIIPLALISAAVGCFAGAFLCAAMLRRRGLICGVLIGVLMFTIIWLIGLMCSDEIFGTETAVKLLMLIVAGGAGGYIGSARQGKRRK